MTWARVLISTHVCLWFPVDPQYYKTHCGRWIICVVFWTHNCLIMLCLLILEQAYRHRRNSQKLLLLSMVGVSDRKIQCLAMDLSKSSFNPCANICLRVTDTLTVNIFRCGRFNSTFPGWSSTREWQRPEICCGISTLHSQCHLVNLWKHYQRNQVTMCLWRF